MPYKHSGSDFKDQKICNLKSEPHEEEEDNEDYFANEAEEEIKFMYDYEKFDHDVDSDD